MLRKKLIWILMIVVLVFVLVSAGLAAPKVKIVVWTWSQEQSQFFQEIKTIFEKKNPNIDLQFVTIAQSQYRNSLPLAFRGDNAPDIFFESNQPTDMVNQGFARSMDEFITPKFKSMFPAEYFYEGICKINGKISALPQSNYKIPRPIYLFYNKTVLKKAGLNPNNPPKTWSQLRAMAKKVTEAGKGDYYGLAMIGKPASDVQRVLAPLASTLGLNENAAGDINYKTGKWMENDPKWEELYNFVKSMKDDGSFFPGFASMDKTLARTYFAQDKAAFFMDGLWMPGTFVSMGYTHLNYGVAPPPIPDRGRQGYMYLTPNLTPMWYMSSQTKYPKEAWKVMSFFYSDQYQEKFVSNNFGYSPLKNFNNVKYIQDPILKEIIKMAPSIARLGVMPSLRNPNTGMVKIVTSVNTIHPTIWEIMTASLNGGMEFKPAVNELAQKVNAEFDKEIKELQDAGVKVSNNDFIFKNWDPMKDYTLDMYEN